MDFKSLLKTIFAEAKKANPNVPDHEFQRLIEQIEQRVDNEAPPRIAVLGECGVGKSSTLNALFNAGLNISHTEACTQEEQAIEVRTSELHGSHGALVVYDMPGLGESRSSERKHLETYERILKSADVALWILDAQDRAITYVQDRLTTDIRRMNPAVSQRMVFALNKVDLVHPGETAWHPLANIPSDEQEANIVARVNDVKRRVKEALPKWRGSLVGYSATKRYNLPQLFSSMLGAVPENRQWVIASRKALADYLELVDVRLLPDDRKPGPVKSTEPSQHEDDSRILDMVSSMDDDTFAKLSKDRTAFENWLKSRVTKKS